MVLSTAPNIPRWKQTPRTTWGGGTRSASQRQSALRGKPAVPARVARERQQKPADGSTHLVLPQDGGGTARPGAGAVAQPRRTARLRIRSPWNALAERGAGREDPQGSGDDGDAAHQPRLHRLSARPGEANRIGPTDSCRAQGRRAVLQEHPQVRFHFTPTCSSWLKQIELWFAKIGG
jgi:hypothetical protein